MERRVGEKEGGRRGRKEGRWGRGLEGKREERVWRVLCVVRFTLPIFAGKKLTHIYTFSSVMSLEYSNGKVITGSGELCKEER